MNKPMAQKLGFLYRIARIARKARIPMMNKPIAPKLGFLAFRATGFAHGGRIRTVPFCRCGSGKLSCQHQAGNVHVKATIAQIPGCKVSAEGALDEAGLADVADQG